MCKTISPATSNQPPAQWRPAVCRRLFDKPRVRLQLLRHLPLLHHLRVCKGHLRQQDVVVEGIGFGQSSLYCSRSFWLLHCHPYKLLALVRLGQRQIQVTTIIKCPGPPAAAPCAACSAAQVAPLVQYCRWPLPA